MPKKGANLTQQAAALRNIHFRCTRLFRELFSRRIDGNWQMRIRRRRQAQALLQPNLAHNRINQICAAHDGIDALCGVIDDHGQLISEQPIRA